jgi:hypothetical protein
MDAPGVTSTGSIRFATNKRIVVAYYERQDFNDQAVALYLSELFARDNQVQTQYFAQGEDAIGGWQARFTRPLEWILEISPDATPEP